MRTCLVPRQCAASPQVHLQQVRVQRPEMPIVARASEVPRRRVPYSVANERQRAEISQIRCVDVMRDRHKDIARRVHAKERVLHIITIDTPREAIRQPSYGNLELHTFSTSVRSQCAVILAMVA